MEPLYTFLVPSQLLWANLSCDPSHCKPQDALPTHSIPWTLPWLDVGLFWKAPLLRDAPQLACPSLAFLLSLSQGSDRLSWGWAKGHFCWQTYQHLSSNLFPLYSLIWPAGLTLIYVEAEHTFFPALLFAASMPVWDPFSSHFLIQKPLLSQELCAFPTLASAQFLVTEMAPGVPLTSRTKGWRGKRKIVGK